MTLHLLVTKVITSGKVHRALFRVKIRRRKTKRRKTKIASLLKFPMAIKVTMKNSKYKFSFKTR